MNHGERRLILYDRHGSDYELNHQTLTVGWAERCVSLLIRRAWSLPSGQGQSSVLPKSIHLLHIHEEARKNSEE